LLVGSESKKELRPHLYTLVEYLFLRYDYRFSSKMLQHFFCQIPIEDEKATFGGQITEQMSCNSVESECGERVNKNS
jgi:hypothetical protein